MFSDKCVICGLNLDLVEDLNFDMIYYCSNSFESHYQIIFNEYGDLEGELFSFDYENNSISAYVNIIAKETEIYCNKINKIKIPVYLGPNQINKIKNYLILI